MNTYSWTLGDGSSANTSSVTHTYINTSFGTRTFTAQLIASDANGCLDTAKQVIKVYSSPVALFDATPDTLYLPNTSVIISNLSSGSTSYDWSFGDGGTSTDAIPTHSYSSPNSYQIILVAKAAHSCVDTFKLGKKIVVLGETEFNMPNAFTPNTSGSPGNAYGPTDLSNDIFHPQMKGVVDFKFTIYSRWGEILFETTDPKLGWDGYYRGVLCKQDVYVWKLYAKFYNDQVVNKTGDVTLLR